MNKAIILNSLKKYKLGYTMIIIAVIFITIINSVVMPYLVKSIIDNNIVNTQGYWYETKDCNSCVVYNNTNYLKANQASKQVKETSQKVLLKYKDNQYYFGNEPLSKDEVKSFFAPGFSNSLKIVLFFFVTFVLNSLIAYIANMKAADIAYHTVYDLRKRALKILFKLDMPYFDQTSDGQTITYLINDAQSFYRLLTYNGIVLLNTSIVYLTITFVMLQISIYLFIIALVILPLFILWLLLYRKIVLKYFDQERDSLNNMNSLTNEQILGIDLIKTYQYEEQAKRRFFKDVDNYYDASSKALKYDAIYSNNMITLLKNLLTSLVIFFFGFNYLQGNNMFFKAGLVYLLVYFVNSITQPLHDLINTINSFNEISVSLTRLDEFYQKPYLKQPIEPITISAGLVKFKDVDFGYNEDLVIKNLSIEFKAGVKNAIVGSTGSGKSTIISLLMKYYQPNSGQILIDDLDISLYSDHSIHEQISIVLQKTYLFEGSIYDNISLNNNYDYDEIMALARKANATFITNHPDGLNQKINETATNFSVGQKQIIALLRALIKKPKILIFDEASSNLDMESEASINALIDDYKMSIIIIAHRIATIASCQQIYVLEKGELVEQGSHQELMNNKAQYYNNIKSLQ